MKKNQCSNKVVESHLFSYYKMVKYMQFEFYKNVLAINNYRQIKQMRSDLIELENLRVQGKNLKVLKLDKDTIIVEGVIVKLEMGDA